MQAAEPRGARLIGRTRHEVQMGRPSATRASEWDDALPILPALLAQTRPTAVIAFPLELAFRTLAGDPPQARLRAHVFV